MRRASLKRSGWRERVGRKCWLRVASSGRVAVGETSRRQLVDPQQLSAPYHRYPPKAGPVTAQGWDPTQPRRATRTSTVSTPRSVAPPFAVALSLAALSSLPEKTRRTDLSQPTVALHLQALIETVIRKRIYEATYWKEHCFALSGPSSAAFLSAHACLFSELITSPPLHPSLQPTR